jgi:hypothetical protein
MMGVNKHSWRRQQSDCLFDFLARTTRVKMGRSITYHRLVESCCDLETSLEIDISLLGEQKLRSMYQNTLAYYEVLEGSLGPIVSILPPHRE